MVIVNESKSFKKLNDIVGCFIEHNNKFLLLHRNDHKKDSDCWGLPAGKVEDGETFEEATRREVREETGIILKKAEVEFFKSLKISHNGRNMEHHMFSTKLEYLPEVVLDPKEHQDFRWVDTTEALVMNLIHDLDECIKIFYKIG